MFVLKSFSTKSPRFFQLWIPYVFNKIYKPLLSLVLFLGRGASSIRSLPSVYYVTNMLVTLPPLPSLPSFYLVSRPLPPSIIPVRRYDSSFQSTPVSPLLPSTHPTLPTEDENESPGVFR